MPTCNLGPCWTASPFDGTNFDTQSATTFNNRWIVGGQNNTNGNSVIQYSSDGINWTRVDVGYAGGGGVKGFASGNGILFGIVNFFYHIQSNDGINWTIVSHWPPVSGEVGLAFGAGNFVLTVNSADQFAYSPNGQAGTWNITNCAPFTFGYMNRARIYGGGLFVTVGSSGFSYSSSPTTPVTAVPYPVVGVSSEALAYGSGAYVATTRSRSVYRSTDGINWTLLVDALPSTPDGINQQWITIIHSQGYFMCCKLDSKYLAISPDGITWTLTSGDHLFDSSPNSGYNVLGTDGNGQYIAVKPLSSVSQVGVCPCFIPITGDYWIRTNNVNIQNVLLGKTQPAPPPQDYYWTATNGYTFNAALYANGQYLIFSPNPGDTGTAVYVRSKAIITGKQYCEFEVTAAATNSYVAFGVTQQIVDTFYNTGSGNIFVGNGGCGLAARGLYNNGSNISTNSKYNFTVGDRIGIAFDADTKAMWISKNGTWLDGDPNTLSSPSMTVAVPGDLYFYNGHYTCTVPGSKTAYIYPDAAQQSYAAPSGFVSYAS